MSVCFDVNDDERRQIISIGEDVAILFNKHAVAPSIGITALLKVACACARHADVSVDDLIVMVRKWCELMESIDHGETKP